MSPSSELQDFLDFSETLKSLPRQKTAAEDPEGYWLHLMSLKGITPVSTHPAYWNDRAGNRHEIEAPAMECFDAWNGYWHNFRLADWVWKTFPSAVSCGYILTPRHTS